MKIIKMMIKGILHTLILEKLTYVRHALDISRLSDIFLQNLTNSANSPKTRASSQNGKGLPRWLGAGWRNTHTIAGTAEA